MGKNELWCQLPDKLAESDPFEATLRRGLNARRRAMRFAASSFQTYDPAGFCGWCFFTFLSVAPRGKHLAGSLSYVEQVTDNDVARIKYVARWGLMFLKFMP